MRRLAVLVTVALGIAVPAGAAELQMADLLAAPESFAGVEITVRGELVGDFMRRGDVVWVQLNGDAYATEPLHAGGGLAGTNQGIAARFDSDLFDSGGFEEPGGYRVTGAVIEATGIWRYHDPGRSGESYLEVLSFDIVERERRTTEELPLEILLPGIVLVIIGVMPRAVERMRRR
jgi:hypothetical protein